MHTGHLAECITTRYLQRGTEGNKDGQEGVSRGSAFETARIAVSIGHAVGSSQLAQELRLTFG